MQPQNLGIRLQQRRPLIVLQSILTCNFTHNYTALRGLFHKNATRSEMNWKLLKEILLIIFNPVKLWRYVSRAWTILWHTRAALIGVTIAILVLFFTDQGKEIALALEPSCAAWDFGCLWVWSVQSDIWFQLGVTVLAFSSWYWSRTALDLERYRVSGVPLEFTEGSFEEWLFKYTPRVLGCLTFIVVAGSLIVAGFQTKGVGLAALFFQAGMNLVFAAIIFRVAQAKRSKSEAMRGLETAATRRKGWAWFWFGNGTVQDSYKDVWSVPPFTKFALAITILLFIAGAALTYFCPATCGMFLGSPLIILLFLAGIIPLGTLLTVWGNRLDYPLIGALVVWAVLISWTNDNHGIRPIADKAAAPSKSVGLEPLLTAWQGRPGAEKAGNQMVVVAAAGGGLRAAYWTAAVLAYLEDNASAFKHKLFAVSGVSGGSLGAVVHRSLGETGNIGCRPTSVKEGDNFPVARRALSILSHDFLAPAVASSLSLDALQRFLPGAWLPDRAAALEYGFERGWLKVHECSQPENKVGLRRPFEHLQGPDHHDFGWPALFLNGTPQETGRRIITAPVSIDRTFRDAMDFFALSSGNIRLSTAVTNSARFTYVSPAGLLQNGKSNGHIVDGGYFENFGAETASEIAEFLEPRLKDGTELIRIQISSDPKLDDTLLKSRSSQGDCIAPELKKEGEGGVFGWLKSVFPRILSSLANEALAPLRALLATRNARGMLASVRFAGDCEKNNYYYFRMCEGLEPNPPLGWLMSPNSRDAIENELVPAKLRRPGGNDTGESSTGEADGARVKATDDGMCGNRATFQALIDRLNGN